MYIGLNCFFLNNFNNKLILFLFNMFLYLVVDNFNFMYVWDFNNCL